MFHVKAPQNIPKWNFWYLNTYTIWQPCCQLRSRLLFQEVAFEGKQSHETGIRFWYRLVDSAIYFPQKNHSFPPSDVITCITGL
jgi:hypothetical protein